MKHSIKNPFLLVRKTASAVRNRKSQRNLVYTYFGELHDVDLLKNAITVDGRSLAKNRKKMVITSQKILFH